MAWRAAIGETWQGFYSAVGSAVAVKEEEEPAKPGKLTLLGRIIGRFYIFLGEKGTPG